MNLFAQPDSCSPGAAMPARALSGAGETGSFTCGADVGPLGTDGSTAGGGTTPRGVSGMPTSGAELGPPVVSYPAAVIPGVADVASAVPSPPCLLTSESSPNPRASDAKGLYRGTATQPSTGSFPLSSTLTSINFTLASNPRPFAFAFAAPLPPTPTRNEMSLD